MTHIQSSRTAIPDERRRTNDYVAAVLIFRDALSPLECAQIRRLAISLPPANVAVYPPTATVLRKAATKVLDFVENSHWLPQRLMKFAHAANERFQMDINDEVRPIMCVSYGVGDYFDWHTDLADGDESTRKISISVQLSPSNSYEGGRLQMIADDAGLPASEEGTLVAFPAHLGHRVTTVTSGERHALVAWVHGPPFK